MFSWNARPINEMLLTTVSKTKFWFVGVGRKDRHLSAPAQRDIKMTSKLDRQRGSLLGDLSRADRLMCDRLGGSSRVGRQIDGQLVRRVVQGRQTYGRLVR